MPDAARAAREVSERGRDMLGAAAQDGPPRRVAAVIVVVAIAL